MIRRRIVVFLLSGVLAGLLLLGAHSSIAQGQTVLTLTALDVGVAETGVIEGRVDCRFERLRWFQNVAQF